MSKEQVIKDKLALIVKNAITANTGLKSGLKVGGKVLEKKDDWRNSTHQM